MDSQCDTFNIFVCHLKPHLLRTVINLIYLLYIYIKRVSVGSVQAWPVFSRPGDPEQTAP